MTRRQLFHAPDLARAIKVTQQTGLAVARVEIEPTGKIVLHMPDSIPGYAPDPVLEAVRKKIADRRTERLAVASTEVVEFWEVGRWAELRI